VFVNTDFQFRGTLFNLDGAEGRNFAPGTFPTSAVNLSQLESLISTGSGYVVFGGVMLAWGIVTGGAGGTINFPNGGFSSANLGISLTPVGPSAQNLTPTITANNETSVTYVGSGNNTSIRWIAVGPKT